MCIFCRPVTAYTCQYLHLLMHTPVCHNTYTCQYMHISIHTTVSAYTCHSIYTFPIHTFVSAYTCLSQYLQLSIHTPLYIQTPSIPPSHLPHWKIIHTSTHFSTVDTWCKVLQRNPLPHTPQKKERRKKETKMDTIIGSYYSSLHQNSAMFVSSFAEKPNLSDKRWHFQQGSPSAQRWWQFDF